MLFKRHGGVSGELPGCDDARGLPVSQCRIPGYDSAVVYLGDVVAQNVEGDRYELVDPLEPQSPAIPRSEVLARLRDWGIVFDGQKGESLNIRAAQRHCQQMKMAASYLARGNLEFTCAYYQKILDDAAQSGLRIDQGRVEQKIQELGRKNQQTTLSSLDPKQVERALHQVLSGRSASSSVGFKLFKG